MKSLLKGKARRAKVHRVVVPLARPGSAYNGRAVSGPGMDHQGSCAESLRMNRSIFSCVRGERRPRPLMTSMTAGQGSNKSAKKEYGETWVRADVNHK